MSGPNLDVLGSHLRDETEALLGVLDAAPGAAWQTSTPSTGWSVADQVSHLAYFDEAATVSVVDPTGFSRYLDDAMRLGASLCDDVAERYRTRTPEELRTWWVGAREAMLAAMLEAGASTRVPWYGPSYSVASAITGRIMETWAHGQDVYDALYVAHPATAALYDVARLCARTRANSYASRGREVPREEVGVVLVAPDGATWTFGDDTGDVVRGAAVEFCLVATQRRHRDDTDLDATGPLAAEWLSIAQAFAGPPGEGRPPVDLSR